MTTRFSLCKPNDFHTHFRDETALERTVPDCARHFQRAVAMPNLTPPVQTVEAALAYRERILAASPEADFDPCMTLYLSDQISDHTLQAFAASTHCLGIKYYPKNATTNAEAGVSDIEKVYPQLASMERLGIPLMMHGESTREDIDVFDREKYFIDDTLLPLMQRFPNLRMTLEHITTAHAVDCIQNSPPHIGATITPHHLLFHRNALFAGGLRPHFYCLPLLKTQPDQVALIKAATSGDPHFFLGTDSAPHTLDQKENACGCAGIYNMPAAMPALLSLFESLETLPTLEAFASHNGAAFYGLPQNTATATYCKQAFTVPLSLPFEASEVIPLFAGETLLWQLEDTPCA